jgi:hypothetical protein
VFEKYADKRFKRSSTYVESQMQRGFSLPKLPKGSMVVDNTAVAQFLK